MKRLERVGGWLGWALAVPPAALALARLTHYEGRSVIIAAEALTPIIYLPAYAAVALAILSRQRVLAAVAGTVVVLHLVWVLPEFRPARPLPESAHSAPRLRIFSANLRYTNLQMDAMAGEIRRSDPDVVFVQELSEANFEALGRTGVLAAYPFDIVAPVTWTAGSGIFSKLPLTDTSIWNVEGMLNTRATVDLAGSRVRLFDVHTNAPFGGAADRWERQLETIKRTVEAEPDPLIVAGDFNATYGHRPFRQLLDAGLRDAHVERGRGWARTWPRTATFPAFARIDHVLVTPDFAVLGIKEGTGRGSDHRPVIAELALLPARR